MNAKRMARNFRMVGLALQLGVAGCDREPERETGTTAPAVGRKPEPEPVAQPEEASETLESLAPQPQPPAAEPQEPTPAAAEISAGTNKIRGSSRGRSTSPRPDPAASAPSPGWVERKISDSVVPKHRDPLVPHHDEDDRFSELRVLENPSAREMTFKDYGVNPTIATEEENVSTFAVDVDTASYGVVRSYLQRGTMPSEAAVRVEEMINAFDYAYSAPNTEPFLVQAEAFPSPNRKGYHVLHIGVKSRTRASSCSPHALSRRTSYAASMPAPTTTSPNPID